MYTVFTDFGMKILQLSYASKWHTGDSSLRKFAVGVYSHNSIEFMNSIYLMYAAFTNTNIWNKWKRKHDSSPVFPQGTPNVHVYTELWYRIEHCLEMVIHRYIYKGLN